MALSSITPYITGRSLPECHHISVIATNHNPAPFGPLHFGADVGLSTTTTDINSSSLRKCTYPPVTATPYTPAPSRPLRLGADVVLSSTTKYIAGHSDTVGGVLATRHAPLAAQLRFLQNAAGAVMSPWDAYLALRGAKTLHVRMQRHCENALELARRLEAHSSVSRVVYPGLESHPQRELAARQMRLESAAPGAARADAPAFGGMISFTLKGGLEESRRFLESLRVFVLAESLGGVESLAEHPAIMTHGSVPAAERAALGISDSFVRLSVGIEHVEDLWADLEQALAAAVAVGAGAGKAAGDGSKADERA